MNTSNIADLTQQTLIPWAIHIGMALLIFVMGRWAIALLVNFLQKLLRKSNMDEMLVGFICSMSKAVLILFVIIAALNELGINTTSLVALIGAAGLAVGLSLQSTLKNFAAGVMLLVFKPFKKGDVVDADGIIGTVEKINIFTTVMKTGDNCEIIVPNGHIYERTITNFSARDTRRIDMVFGVSYDADIRQVKVILNEILAADSRILEDPAPLVAVAELADSSVNFNVRPWVKSEDYWKVLYDVTEQVKLNFDAQQISIPYPQMDVHVRSSSATVLEDLSK